MNNTLIIWEEKDSIEQMMKLEPKPTLGLNDGINEIKNVYVKNACEDIGNKKIWKRKCPNCPNIIDYKNKHTLYVSIKNKTLCRLCCIRDVKGENNPFYGKHHTKEKRKYWSKIRSGRKSTLETKELLSKQRKGKCTPKMYSQIRELHKKQIGRPFSEITKQKLREARAKQILTLGGGSVYNPIACKYFDKLNEEKRWNLQHALKGGEFNCIGYFIDGYDKDKNIVLEYDEYRHYNRIGELKQRDVDRMNKIKNYLKCKFYRYNEITSELKEY